jgi:LAO/AO transport system kinase
VLVPESGDSIQAMKAGLMEIADFFVINKSDRAGAEQAVRSIKTVLGFKPQSDGWNPDVVQTVASEGKGVERIVELIAAHRKYLEAHGGLSKKRQERMAERIRELIAERLRVEFWNGRREESLAGGLDKIARGATTPYDVAEELLRNFNH